MERLEIRRFDDPDSHSTPPLAAIDMVQVGGLSIGRARYEPGWRWSEHVGAATGERWCRVAHVGLVVGGRNIVTMEDGRKVEMRAGDLFSIGPGHDSAVVGDEPYESLHFVGTEEYATQAARQADAE